MSNPLLLTELVLRDAHQSLLATRFRLEDMLPIAEKLDKMGYWSVETWGGATFDSCIRYLGEDPWARIRAFKKAMPNTKQQMLLRGQNLLGYRHYADDVVKRFVERAHQSGVDVFRIFDAMNDIRNLETAIQAAVNSGAHAQGTISYTVSPVHTIDMWLDMAKQLEDMGSHSICIKDMAGLLKPHVAFDLVTKLKETVSIPIALHSHATTGLSVATCQKAIDAGIDMLDGAVSTMSMTYGHSATETLIAMVEDTPRSTGLDLNEMTDIATYFRDVRAKYSQFEGSLKGVDARILTAQVPGGMLTNMENQLKEQGAADRLDEVLLEIPKVRKDLGFIPLVTPTSQIVGTQAVLNVLTGERYKSITKETAGVLKGEYGATAAQVDAALQERVLEGKQAITCRPADKIEPELDALTAELDKLAAEKGITLAEQTVDDVLTYALFPQIGFKFLANRNNPDAFEKAPSNEPEVKAAPASAAGATPADGKAEAYSVQVDGKVYQVVVAPDGQLSDIQLAPATTSAPVAAPAAGGAVESINAPLAGNIFKILVKPGNSFAEGEVIMILEAMKMETEIRAAKGGTVASIDVKEGDSVTVGQSLLSFS